MSDDFSGSLEIKQESESEHIHYLNNGNEIHYRVDGKEYLSITEILYYPKKNL